MPRKSNKEEKPPQSILEYIERVSSTEGLIFISEMSNYCTGGLDKSQCEELYNDFGEKIDEFIQEIPDVDRQFFKKKDAFKIIMKYITVKARKSPKPSEDELQKKALKKEEKNKEFEGLDIIEISELKINKLITKEIEFLEKEGYIIDGISKNGKNAINISVSGRKVLAKSRPNTKGYLHRTKFEDNSETEED